MQFSTLVLSALVAVAAAQRGGRGNGGRGNGGRGNGGSGSDRDRSPFPCYFGAATTMDDCKRGGLSCRPTIDCDGNIVYIPYGFPTSL